MLLQRLFNHGQYGLTHIVLSNKKDQTAFELRCTSQNFYPETIRFKSYSPLKYFIQVSTKSLNKFESGTIRVDPYCPFLKNDQFL